MSLGGSKDQFYFSAVTDSDHFFLKWSFGAASARLDFENLQRIGSRAEEEERVAHHIASGNVPEVECGLLDKELGAGAFDLLTEYHHGDQQQGGQTNQDYVPQLVLLMVRNNIIILIYTYLRDLSTIQTTLVLKPQNPPQRRGILPTFPFILLERGHRFRQSNRNRVARLGGVRHFERE